MYMCIYMGVCSLLPKWGVIAQATQVALISKSETSEFLPSSSCLKTLLCASVCVCSVVFDYLWPMDCSLPGSSSLGTNTGVGSHFLLQGIFLTHGSKLHLLLLRHWQMDSLPLHHPGNSSLVPLVNKINKKHFRVPVTAAKSRGESWGWK